MKTRSPQNRTDLSDASQCRVLWHSLLACLLPLGVRNRWPGLRSLFRISLAHYLPVWAYRLELKYRGRIVGWLHALRRRLRGR